MAGWSCWLREGDILQHSSSSADVERDIAAAADFASSLSAARAAWLRGDVVACLEVLQGCDPRRAAPADGADALLLLGRALLRSQQPAAAEQRLAPVLGQFATFDERCTARMLHAAAVTRSASPERGLALLAELASEARAHHAHRAVQAEIAYYRALGHWTKHELGAAAELARSVESEQVDVLSVRATQLLGFVALEQQRYRDALAIFGAALEAYRRCRERDGDLAAQILVQIATLETQLRGATMPGSHGTPRARRVPGDIFGPDASVARCVIAWLDGWQYALDGSAQAALHSMREAERAAPAPAWRVLALSGRALISAAFGEPENARELVGYACELADGVAWRTTSAGETIALLMLAEAAAPIAPAVALEALARYHTATANHDMLLVNVAGDARRIALEAYVNGLLARAAGDQRRARALLDQAYRGFRATGYLWRAGLALIELDATPGSAADFPLETAALLVQEHFPNAFLARRLGRWERVYRDPVAAGLTPAQRNVLRYALEGYGAKEIAAVTARSVKTVANQIASLHEAFGVKSTLRLVAECHRRGLGSPAWRVLASETARPPRADHLRAV